MGPQHTATCTSVDIAMEFVTLAKNGELKQVAARIPEITMGESIGVIIALSSFSSSLLVALGTRVNGPDDAFGQLPYWAANFRNNMPCTCTEDT